MIGEAEERRIREVAVQAAATLLSGTGSDAQGLMHVADVINTYISGGSPAVRHQLGLAAGPEASSQASEITAPDGSVPARVSRAQELAVAGYAATTQAEVQAVIIQAEEEKVLTDLVTEDGVTGTLISYLEMLQRGLPKTGAVPSVRNETLREDLGLS